MTLDSRILGKEIEEFSKAVSISDATNANEIREKGAKAFADAIIKHISETIIGLNIPKSDGSPKTLDFRKVEVTPNGDIIARSFLVADLPIPGRPGGGAGEHGGGDGGGPLLPPGAGEEGPPGGGGGGFRSSSLTQAEQDLGFLGEDQLITGGAQPFRPDIKVTKLEPISADLISASSFDISEHLSWLASGHTGSADSIASFDSAGIAQLLNISQFVQYGGQIGGSGVSPVILGVRETGGPTDLPFGAMPNGTVLGVVAGQIVGVAADKSPDWMLDGVSFVWVSNSTIRLVPSGLDGKARIPVSNGSTLLNIQVSSNLDCVLSTSGAGGLDTGSEAANTGYEVRLITHADGSNQALLATVNGSASTLPGSYTHKSAVIAFMSNDGSSNIRNFFQSGDVWNYHYSDPGVGLVGVQIISAQKATTATAVPCSPFIPSAAESGEFNFRAVNASATIRSCHILDSNGTKRYEARVVSTNDAYETINYETVTWPFNGSPSTDMQYLWTPSAPPEGLDVGILSFRLPRAVGSSPGNAATLGGIAAASYARLDIANVFAGQQTIQRDTGADMLRLNSSITFNGSTGKGSFIAFGDTATPVRAQIGLFDSTSDNAGSGGTLILTSAGGVKFNAGSSSVLGGTDLYIDTDGDVGLGGVPAASCKLDLQSTTGALMLTRMTTTQRDALTAANGMIFYNSTTNKCQIRAAGAWVDLH